MIWPPLHSVASPMGPEQRPLQELCPTTCPASLMAEATLLLKPGIGSTPRSMTLPWFHSVALLVANAVASTKSHRLPGVVDA